MKHSGRFHGLPIFISDDEGKGMLMYSERDLFFSVVDNVRVCASWSNLPDLGWLVLA